MSKLVKMMITSMIIIIIAGAGVLFFVLNNTGADSKDASPSIDDLVKYSFETTEITTDLKDGSFVRIQFKILTDGKDAHKEISQRDFQLTNILIKELAQLDEEAFKTGLSDLEKTVQKKLNEVMEDGEIIEVYTISKILQ